MKATIYLSKEDLRNMLIERWTSRTDRYLVDGPHAARRPVRISELSLYSSGGRVEFTDEPEEPKAPPSNKPDEFLGVQWPVDFLTIAFQR